MRTLKAAVELADPDSLATASDEAQLVLSQFYLQNPIQMPTALLFAEGTPMDESITNMFNEVILFLKQRKVK